MDESKGFFKHTAKPPTTDTAPAPSPTTTTPVPTSVSDGAAERRARITDVVIRVATELALGDRKRDEAGFAHAGAEAQVALVGALIALARTSRDPNAAIRRALEIIAGADLRPLVTNAATV